MIITLESSDPQFSYTIYKNPANQPHVNSIRKGTGLGWFVHDNMYLLYFMEGQDEVSYPDYKGQFAYMAEGRLCSPFVAQNLIKEFFGSSFNSQVVANFTMTIYHLKARERTINYFDALETEYDENQHNGVNKVVRIHASNIETGHFLKLVSLFLLYMNIEDWDFIHKDTNLLDRVLPYLQEVEIPYWVRYKIKTRLLSDRGTFEEYRSLLNYSQTTLYSFTFGDTQQARKDVIKGRLEGRDVVIDVGCGEGQYIKLLRNSVKEYHAADIDPEMLEKAKRHKADFYYSSVDELPEISNAYVLLTEVIEHLDDPKTFLLELKDKLPNSVFIITTPNRAFNQYYNIYLRHEDHAKEYTYHELDSMLNSVFSNVWVSGIGDAVNAHNTTLLAVCE